MKFAIFELGASVDNRPLPGAWVAKLLGVVLGIQDHKKIKFPMVYTHHWHLKIFQIIYFE